MNAEEAHAVLLGEASASSTSKRGVLVPNREDWATSAGSGVFGKIQGFYIFRQINPDVSIPCVMVLFSPNQDSVLGLANPRWLGI